MIDKVSSTSGMYSAMNGMRQAMQNLGASSGQVAKGNPDAEKMVALQVAQQNVEVQTQNVKAMVEASEQILDILV